MQNGGREGRPDLADGLATALLLASASPLQVRPACAGRSFLAPLESGGGDE